MWPSNRRSKKSNDEGQELEESVAYEEISRNIKYSEIAMVYDEADIILFQKTKKKRKIVR